MHALLLRGALRRVRVRIRGGPNAGMYWSATTRRAFRRGYFEGTRVEVICRLAEGSRCLWDLGAHFGYITLAAARRVAAGGSVVAIECNRDNLWYLRKHIEWNGLDGVAVVPAALDAMPGKARFNPVSSGTGLLTPAEDRGYEVDVVSVDSLVSSGAYPAPDVVKVDIDHTYADFLTGAQDTLRRWPVVMTLATNNSPEYHRRAMDTLCDWGYSVHSPHRCADPGSFHGVESELLAVGPGRVVDSDILKAFLES
jgi:FkbM family methyltransferase